MKSRNYRVGFGMGQGRHLEDVQAELGQVAEGVVNARSVKALAELAGVEMPLSALVHAALHEGRIINDLEQLFADRPLKAELE